MASPLGVRVAVEVIPNELSRASSLVHFVEEDIESPEVGICLDFGHAHMDDDLVEVIETVSEHLVTTHVHDNRRRADDHLVPFEGTIDWPAALTAIQKVGYEEPLIFEIAAHGRVKDTLVRAERALKRMDGLLY
jgi:sugar phosphate isomerase/epimerase